MEDLEGFVVEGNAGRPVGVAALGVADVRPPDDEGLLLPLLEEFCPDGKVGCLGATLLLKAGSAWILACCNPITLKTMQQKFSNDDRGSKTRKYQNINLGKIYAQKPYVKEIYAYY